MSNTVENTVNEYVREIDVRREYERTVKSNGKIDAKLVMLAKECAHARIAEIMTEHRVAPSYINIQERSNARFNIYAARKVTNVARVIAAVDGLNHYTRAVLLTALKLEQNGLMLTHSDAQAACSLQVKAKDAKRDKLIVRYSKQIAPSTVTTQSSSSINALQMYHVLTETRDAANTVSYAINHDSEATKKLIAHVS